MRRDLKCAIPAFYKTNLTGNDHVYSSVTQQ